jgi:hypothetical protein
MRHIEVQVLEAPSRVRARSPAASSPDGHATPFIPDSSCLSCLRDSGRRSAPNPVHHVGGMKPPSPTPNRCETSSPRKYARRTVSSWQPMNSATSKAVISRLGRPLFADAASAGSRDSLNSYVTDRLASNSLIRAGAAGADSEWAEICVGFIAASLSSITSHSRSRAAYYGFGIVARSRRPDNTHNSSHRQCVFADVGGTGGRDASESRH